MEIKSRQLANQSIIFFGKEVEFNKDGIADVSDELGVEILQEFPELVYKKGENPNSKVKKNENDTEQVLLLKKEIERLERVNDGLKIQVNSAKESEQNWRNECAKLQKQIELSGQIFVETEIEESETVKMATENGTKIEEGIVVPDGYEEVYKEMENKNLASLKKMCKDDLGMSDETLSEYKGQGAKDKLIKYIFENVVNK